MKSKYFFVLILALNAKICFTQDVSPNYILQKAKSYYENLTRFSIEVRSKAKSQIAEDTTIGSYKFYIDKVNNRKLFILSANISSFVDGKNEYEVYFLRSAFSAIRKKDRKYTMYHQRFKLYPAIEHEFFLNFLKDVKTISHETDSSFSLSKQGYIYEFRKENYSISRITKKVYHDKYKGFAFSETLFSQSIADDPILRDTLTAALMIVNGEINDNEKDKTVSIKRDSLFLVNLNAPNIIVKNQRDKSISGKTILLDFFYQGCLPCLKSHPIMTDIYNNADTNFIVLGIDHKLSDTLNIDSYLRRHNVVYPVIVGKYANEIMMEMKVEAWPTFVLLDPSGKVLEYQEGLSNSFFNSIRRKYTKSLHGK